MTRQLFLFAFVSSLSLAFAKNDTGTYLHSILVHSLVKYFTKIGLNIIESVFAVCDQNFSEQGLTLAEIQENQCVDFLANMFGILYTDIEKDFAAFDKNGDGVVSINEGLNAFKRLGIDRKGLINVEMVLDNMKFFDDPVHGSWKLVNSKGYDEIEKDNILAVATVVRYDHIRKKTYTMDKIGGHGFPKIKYFVYDLESNLSDMEYFAMNCYVREKVDHECNNFLYIYYKYKFRLEDNTFKIDCWPHMRWLW